MQQIVLKAGGIVDWTEYSLFVVFVLTIIAYCSWRFVSSAAQLKPSGRSQTEKPLLLPIAVTIVFWLGIASLFALLFFKVIIREPVHAVRVDQQKVILDGRWAWQSIAISRSDIVRVVPEEKRTLRRTYKIVTIYTPTKAYVIDPEQVGHDGAVAEIVASLRN